MYAKMFLILTLVRYSTCQRRIVDGVSINKPYVVYLVWRNDIRLDEFRDYNTVCGGVLLNQKKVLTSGACLIVHEPQHVIAGYNRYVPRGQGRDNNEKECMAIARRNILQRHWLAAGRPLVLAWHINDVAIAELDKPYDFKDSSFVKKCSYKPTAVNLLYTKPAEGDNVVLLGWGSSRYQAPEHSDFDITEKYLRATASVVIADKECVEAYRGVVYLTKSIDSAIQFCIDGVASVDVHGKYKGMYRRHTATNDTQAQFLSAAREENEYSNETSLNNFQKNFRRRNSVCQNDHGGPVVTYVNGKEYVYGIITGSRVNGNLECVGPSLSTHLVKYKKKIQSHI